MPCTTDFTPSDTGKTSKGNNIQFTKVITKLQTTFHTNNYYAEPLVSFTNSADELLVQIPILLKHVLQEPMSLQ